MGRYFNRGDCTAAGIGRSVPRPGAWNALLPGMVPSTACSGAARGGLMGTAVVDAEGKTVRDINREIRMLIAGGCSNIRIANPGAQHNLGVGIVEPVALDFEGSVGY